MIDRFEIKFGIINEDYRDDLIIALVRQGYMVWNSDHHVSAIVPEDEVEVFSELKDDDLNCDDCEHSKECKNINDYNDNKNKPSN